MPVHNLIKNNTRYRGAYAGSLKKQRRFMADKIIENNQVSMMGKIAAGFTFSHQVFGEGFYMTELLVKRLSDSEDRIPVMVSERLVDVTQDYIGEYVEIHGQFRSYNRHEEKHNRLVLSVFARKSSVWKIRLHTMHLLGQKCPLCICV